MFVLGSAGVVGGIVMFAAASHFGFAVAVVAAVIGGSLSALMAGVAMLLLRHYREKPSGQRPTRDRRG